MAISTVAKSGQITVPKEILDFLKLNPGDAIDFIIDSEDRVSGQRSAVGASAISYNFKLRANSFLGMGWQRMSWQRMGQRMGQRI